MDTLSTSKAKPAAARKAATGRFRVTLGHVLGGLVLGSLLAWGCLFLLIRLAAAALG